MGIFSNPTGSMALTPPPARRAAPAWRSIAKITAQRSLRTCAQGVLFASLIALAGCAAYNQPRYTVAQNASSDVERPAAPDRALTLPTDGAEDGPTTPGDSKATSYVPRLSATTVAGDTDGASVQPTFPADEIDTVIPPLALPSFIDLVFGEILSVPYTTGPGIATRREIVQLRSSGTMPPDVFFNLVKSALNDYGVRISVEDGVFQVLEDTALKARLPRFIKSRARPDTPATLRPVVQFVELQAIDARTMTTILRQAFGRNSENISFDVDNDSNYIILNGLPDDVNAALSIVYEMDELQYAGTTVQRYSPTFWDAAGFATEIERVLSAEGWQVSQSEDSPKPILLLPIQYSNDMLIFTRQPRARARVNYWLRELDRPTAKGDSTQLFIYSVKNIDASVLAETVNQVLVNMEQSKGATRSPLRGNAAAAAARRLAAQQAQAAQVNPNVPGLPPTSNGALAGGAGARPGSGLVVEPLGNRLIYSGSPGDYERLLPLLKQLDQPPAEVLIEMMLAQVTLGDSASLGIDWVINNISDNNIDTLEDGRFGTTNISRNTDERTNLNGIVANSFLGPGGALVNILSPDVEVNLTALAANNKATILSTPRLLARSGSSARVQVGQEVPILSAQTSTGGNFDSVISQVQYRSTGIILGIEPIVFSNNRIDLNISQEISATVPGIDGVGVANSPVFNNTSVSTLLSLEDGGTAVIGGLIQDTISQSQSGVPLLKDIPILGNAFSSESISTDRTELVILITAYVLRGQDDKAAFAEKFQQEIDRTINDNSLTTILPRKF